MIALAQVVCNVLIPLVFVLAMLDIKGQIAMLLVVVILLGQAVRHVISRLGNVLVKLAIQVSLVILVQQTIIEQAMELAQVRFYHIQSAGYELFFHLFLNIYFQLVVVMPRVQVVYNVLIHLVNVPAMLDIKEPNVMLLVVVMQLVQVVHHVMLLLVNALATLDTQELHVIHVPPTITEQVEELVQVRIIL